MAAEARGVGFLRWGKSVTEAHALGDSEGEGSGASFPPKAACNVDCPSYIKKE